MPIIASLVVVNDHFVMMSVIWFVIGHWAIGPRQLNHEKKTPCNLGDSAIVQACHVHLLLDLTIQKDKGLVDQGREGVEGANADCKLRPDKIWKRTEHRACDWTPLLALKEYGKEVRDRMLSWSLTWVDDKLLNRVLLQPSISHEFPTPTNFLPELKI